MNDAKSATPQAPLERTGRKKTKSDSLTVGRLDELTGFAGRRITQHLASLVAEVQLKEGLRPHQFTALSMIVDNPLMSQSDLARALGIKPSNIVPLIDEMESRELVRREKSATNRSSHALVASSQGKRLRNRIFALVVETENAALTSLTEEERGALTRIARKLGLL